MIGGFPNDGTVLTCYPRPVKPRGVRIVASLRITMRLDSAQVKAIQVASEALAEAAVDAWGKIAASTTKVAGRAANVTKEISSSERLLQAEHSLTGEQSVVRNALKRGDALATTSRSSTETQIVSAPRAVRELPSSAPHAVPEFLNSPHKPTPFLTESNPVATEFSPENIAKLLGRKFEVDAPPQISAGIPKLTPDGYLPYGIHLTTYTNLMETFATNPHRAKLGQGMLHALHDLKQHGFEDVYLGGSYVTRAHLPNDFDLTYRSVGTSQRSMYRQLPLTRDREMMREAYGGEVLPDLQEYFLQNDRIGRKIGIAKIDMTTLPSRPAGESPAQLIMNKYGGARSVALKITNERETARLNFDRKYGIIPGP